MIHSFMKKVLLILAAVILLMLPGKTSVFADQVQENGFTIDLSVGINGNYRYGAPVPVMTEIESEKDFEGTLRIIIPSGGYSYIDDEAVAYEKELTLTADSPKNIELTISTNGLLSYYYIQVEDEKGKLLINRKVTSTAVSSECPLTGILSDDYTALGYFNGAEIETDYFTETAGITELSEKNFPEDAASLQAMSYLIINSFDTSRLSEEQQQALLDWVRDGGILVVGTGSDYRQTLSMFPEDVLSVMVNGNLSSELALVDNDTLSLDFTQKDGICDLYLTSGMPVSDVLTDSSLIWSKSCGNGKIVVTAFNLGMEPVNSWSMKTAMASSLLSEITDTALSERIQNVIYGTDSNNSYVLQEAYQPRTVDPSLVMAILLLFALMIPVTYFILKKTDKSQLLWAIVPAEAVAMTVLVLLATLSLRVKTPETTSLTFIDGTSTYRQSYMSILTPDTRWSSVTLNSDVSSFRIGQEESYWYIDDTSDTQKDTDYAYIIRQNAQGTEFSMKKNTNFDSTYCCFETENNREENLTADLARTLTGISGSVTNNSRENLNAVCVYTSSSIIVIGSLEAGETKSFDETDNRIFYYSYDAAYPDVDPASTEYTVISDVYSNLSNQFNNNEDMSKVMLVGFCKDYSADFIADEKVAEQNYAVFSNMIDASYEDYPNSCQLSLFQFASSDNNQDWDCNDGEMYSLTAEETFQFQGVITEIYGLMKAADSYSYYGSTDETQIYAYNYETGQYDELFTDGDMEVFDDGCPYLQNDEMHMRFTCKEEYDDYVPKIMVIGE